MHHVRRIRHQTQPAEAVPAPVTRHVVAAARLLDVDAARRAGFRAHGLDLRERGRVFGGGGFGAAGARVPRAVAGQAEGGGAVGAGDLLLCGAGGGRAGVGGEVFAAGGREAGYECGGRGEEVFCEGFVEAVWFC